MLNKSKYTVSDPDERILVSDHQKKGNLKITRNHELAIRKLQNKAKKNNIKLIGVSENARDNANATKISSEK